MTFTTSYHLSILSLCFMAAAMGIFSIPQETSSLASWLTSLSISKAIGFAGAYAFYRLYRRWRKTDKGIQYYEKQLFS